MARGQGPQFPPPRSQVPQQRRTPRLPPAEIQRIIRDVLIARTARRAGALLVTDNVRDFERIKPFCNVRLRRVSEYFAR